MNAGAGKRRGLLALCALLALLFAGLGTWQVQRLAWKRDLIQRVEARIHAPPVPAPLRPQWPQLEARDIEYRRVRAHGVFLHDLETLVDALTVRGPGAWVITPLRTAGGIILVNRGFVPPEHRDPDTRAAGQIPGEVTVTGLARLSEPEGRLLRPNDPAADRWFSRDVPAIARSRQLGEVAPYFIDAEAQPSALPIGGMTMVQFRNAHLGYAATWFALAALCTGGMFVLLRDGAGRRVS